ncbi:MAG: leucine-rich repeat protein, partial [Bacteroidales bacterium]|nr:leucine-rich repeat protein [Bacteroidales bacterium]
IYIGDNVFNGCSGLKSINIPNLVTAIGYATFSNCRNLVSISIPNSVTSIGNVAFASCDSLTSIIIPNSVTSIGDYAFAYCSGLTSVTIGNSVTTIGEYTFAACTCLIEMYVKAINPPLVGSAAFSNIGTTIPVYVPCGRATTYQNVLEWSYFSNITGNIPYSVTLESNNTTMGTASITQSNSCSNPIAVILATPEAGYHFMQWSDSVMNNPRTITVSSDTSFTAVFAAIIPEMYNVTVLANNTSMGTVTGDGVYAVNSNATISATPNTGYHFVQWNDGITNNPRTITVISDISFTAIFAADVIHGMYNVIVLANSTSMGTVRGDGVYAVNSNVTISATPNTGYRFVQWNDSIADNPRTITVVSDTIFTANFEAIKYTITAQSNTSAGGTVSGGGEYAVNTTITLRAIPNANYRFLQWDDGNTQNPRTVIVTQDMTYTAIFAVNIQGMFYVLGLSNDTTMGTVTGSGDYSQNSTATLTAIPKTGYRFVRWNDGNVDNPRAIVVTQDITLTAQFEAIKYRVSVIASNSSMGTVFGGGDYNANSVVTISASAYSGYRFTQWNDGNTNNPRSFTVVSDTNFAATFEIMSAITDIELSSVAVYPNPARDNISVILPDNVSNAVIIFYDMQGKILIRQNIGNEDVISVSNLAAGIYMYNVRTEKESYTGKIIIIN